MNGASKKSVAISPFSTDVTFRIVPNEADVHWLSSLRTDCGLPAASFRTPALGRRTWWRAGQSFSRQRHCPLLRTLPAESRLWRSRPDWVRHLPVARRIQTEGLAQGSPVVSWSRYATLSLSVSAWPRFSGSIRGAAVLANTYLHAFRSTNSRTRRRHRSLCHETSA